MAEMFTAEMLELWRQCLAMQKTGGNQRWEEQGGCRGSYRDASMRLHLALGLSPHEWNPLDACGEAPPSWMRETWRLRRYRLAHQLAVLLEKAADRADDRARPRSPAPAARRRMREDEPAWAPTRSAAYRRRS
jgi:hypothetical protein